MRGFLVMKGYYQMPEKTAQAIDAEGWLHSGDLTTMNPQGYLNIVGRLKDMIIRGGENLYPAEIEQLLMRHPDVAEAQVVGVPDPASGERACAVIVVAPGETFTFIEMIEHLKSSDLIPQKLPEQLELVDALPRNPSGKVLKRDLRKQFSP